MVQVHVLFDHPEIWDINLKSNVQKKRDAGKKQIPPLQGPISDDTEVPTPKMWPSFLANRQDKRKLVVYIGEKLKLAQEWLQPGQTLIVGGCFMDKQTYRITQGSIEAVSNLYSNHEEADTRIFLHVAWSQKLTCVIVASDSDLLFILLLNHGKFPNKQMVIQSSDQRGRLDMKKLMDMMEDDPNTDLSRIRKDGISTAFFYGFAHLLAGTDILCSPRGFGPAYILRTATDFATYLFDKDKGLQHLCKAENNSQGAYVRFVLALFKKKYSTKIKGKPEEILSPAADYSEIISEVQRNTWVHTVESKSMLPSQDCLLLREKNISFQLQIWTQATSAIINVPKPEEYGWEKTDSGYHLQPDSAENLAKQKSIYDTIMHKSGCKTSQCLTLRCGCKKNGG